MPTPRERVIEWLRDAHAAEEQAHTVLGRTAQQIDGHAEFRQGLERHSELSKGQAVRLEQALDRLGEGASTVKDVAARAAGIVQTLSGYFVGDEPVKALLATSTFAQMELSSYRILATAATAARLDDVATLCNSLLAEETAFGRWLEQQTEMVTREYLINQKAEA